MEAWKKIMSGYGNTGETDLFKEHSKHHSKKHISDMKKEMKKGATFKEAHKKASVKVLNKDYSSKKGMSKKSK